MKKILFSSDCNGNFQTLFQKVNQLNKKNGFDLMFLTGNVLTVQSSESVKLLREGSIKIQIPTYFINNSVLSTALNVTYPDGHQLAPNLYLLGSKGLKNINGLNVCYVNGVSQIQGDQSKKLLFKRSQFNKSDIDQLCTLCKGQKIDLLLTNQWPLQINCQSNNSIIKSPLISKLVVQICPKYHLAATGKSFFRLNPYKNRIGTFTYFINVAQIINKDLKDKYLLAIQTVPYKEDPSDQIVSNYIQSPFLKTINKLAQTSKNPVQKNKKQASQINNKRNNIYQRFGESYVEQENNLKSQNINANQKSKIQVNDNTYVFFDGFPSQAQNVDIQQFLERWGSISKIQIYKQLKGNFRSGIVKFSRLQQTTNCLNDTGKFALYQNRIKFKPRTIQQKYHNQDCWFCDKNQKFDKQLLIYRGTYSSICLDKGPVSQFHLQIIPINHVSNTGKLQALQMQEIQFVKRQLKRQFVQNGFQVICYERYIRLSEQINHCIIHFIAFQGIPNILNKFNEINMKNRCGFKKMTKQSRKNQYFIKIEIQNNQFIKQIHQKQRVDGDYMRKIICQIIDKPNLINWRDCQVSNQQISKRKLVVSNILKRCHIQIDTD